MLCMILTTFDAMYNHGICTNLDLGTSIGCGSCQALSISMSWWNNSHLSCHGLMQWSGMPDDHDSEISIPADRWICSLPTKPVNVQQMLHVEGMAPTQ